LSGDTPLISICFTPGYPFAQQKDLNIIFILTDDHRWDAMSSMGHPFIKTPHLDKLADDGILFENTFVTTSLCSPSMASFLTGQYAHRHGVVTNYTPWDNRNVTFVELLRTAGWRSSAKARNWPLQAGAMFLSDWEAAALSTRPRECAKEISLAVMLQDLIVQNIEQNPHKLSDFKKLDIAIGFDVFDVAIKLTLEFADSVLTIQPGIKSQSKLNITADSGTIMNLSNQKIKWGLPHYFDETGREIMRP